MLSNTSRYAIRALIYLAIHENDGRKIGIKKIAEELNIPSPFLGKILQTLAKQKLLNSTKGPNGGFSVSDKSKELSLFDIIKIIDGDDLFDQCLITDKTCSAMGSNPCSIHKHYKPIRENLRLMFEGHTIQNLAEEFKSSGATIEL